MGACCVGGNYFRDRFFGEPGCRDLNGPDAQSECESCESTGWHPPQTGDDPTRGWPGIVTNGLCGRWLGDDTKCESVVGLDAAGNDGVCCANADTEDHRWPAVLPGRVGYPNPYTNSFCGAINNNPMPNRHNQLYRCEELDSPCEEHWGCGTYPTDGCSAWLTGMDWNVSWSYAWTEHYYDCSAPERCKPTEKWSCDYLGGFSCRESIRGTHETEQICMDSCIQWYCSPFNYPGAPEGCIELSLSEREAMKEEQRSHDEPGGGQSSTGLGGYDSREQCEADIHACGYGAPPKPPKSTGAVGSLSHCTFPSQQECNEDKGDCGCGEEECPEGSIIYYEKNCCCSKSICEEESVTAGKGCRARLAGHAESGGYVAGDVKCECWCQDHLQERLEPFGVWVTFFIDADENCDQSWEAGMMALYCPAGGVGGGGMGGGGGGTQCIDPWTGLPCPCYADGYSCDSGGMGGSMTIDPTTGLPIGYDPATGYF